MSVQFTLTDGRPVLTDGVQFPLTDGWPVTLTDGGPVFINRWMSSLH